MAFFFNISVNFVEYLPLRIISKNECDSIINLNLKAFLVKNERPYYTS